uniref:Uncharacterized protein n=1 Tax=Mustela putorius furo TaxID=9669 RepID=M3Z568_MUSPF
MGLPYLVPKPGASPVSIPGSSGQVSREGVERPSPWVSGPLIPPGPSSLASRPGDKVLWSLSPGSGHWLTSPTPCSLASLGAPESSTSRRPKSWVQSIWPTPHPRGSREPPDSRSHGTSKFLRPRLLPQSTWPVPSSLGLQPAPGAMLLRLRSGVQSACPTPRSLDLRNSSASTPDQSVCPTPLSLAWLGLPTSPTPARSLPLPPTLEVQSFFSPTPITLGSSDPPDSKWPARSTSLRPSLSDQPMCPTASSLTSLEPPEATQLDTSKFLRPSWSVQSTGPAGVFSGGTKGPPAIWPEGLRTAPPARSSPRMPNWRPLSEASTQKSPLQSRCPGLKVASGWGTTPRLKLSAQPRRPTSLSSWPASAGLWPPASWPAPPPCQLLWSLCPRAPSWDWEVLGPKRLPDSLSSGWLASLLLSPGPSPPLGTFFSNSSSCCWASSGLKPALRALIPKPRSWALPLL